MTTYSKFPLCLICVFVFFGCDNDSNISYPISYNFDAVEVNDSKHFLVTENSLLELPIENINPGFMEVLQEEVVFQNIGFPFENITLLSENKLSIKSASFATDTLNTVLDYERISEEKIEIDFNSIFNEKIEFYNTEAGATLELCFHANAHTFIETAGVEYSEIDLDFCDLQRNAYEELAVIIREQNNLENSDTIFVNFTNLLFSKVD